MSYPDRNPGPIRVAIVNDCELVVAGMATLFGRYHDRIQVVEISADQAVDTDHVDVVLYDAYASTESHAEVIPALLRQSGAQVVVYSWHSDLVLIAEARRNGAAGYLSKTMSADELVRAIEAIHRGDLVALDPPALGPAARGDWPGREAGLSARESEVLALVARGLTNHEIADALYLSINSVKTYIRTVYRKIGVKRRSQAVLWAMANGISRGDLSGPRTPSPPTATLT